MVAVKTVARWALGTLVALSLAACAAGTDAPPSAAEIAAARVGKAWEMIVASDEAAFLCDAPPVSGWRMDRFRADAAKGLTAVAPDRAASDVAAELDARERLARGKMRRFLENDGCADPAHQGVLARRGGYAAGGFAAALDDV